MAPMSSQPQLVRFGVYEVDLRSGEVRKAGIRLKLGGQPFQVLKALLERPNELVTREELRQLLWPANTFVDHDLALKKAINRLRDVLADSADSPRYIETVPRRGYRFIGSIIPATRAIHAPPDSLQSVAQPPVALLPIPPIANPAATVSIPDHLQTSPQPSPTLPQAIAVRWTIAAVLAVIGIAAVFFGFNVQNVRGRIFAESRASGIRSVAVLPLVNLSSDPAQEYFSDGMTDELITELAKFGNLRVISHTSVERYKRTKTSLPEIARELGVDAVVEGRVLRSGDRVRISAQLIDARSDQHLWAQSYDRDLRDVLSLQAEVAQRIASQIGVSLTAGERSRITGARAMDPAAHEAYLKGTFYWNRLTCRDFGIARSFFEDAVAKDPDFPAAHSGLSDSYFNLAHWGCVAGQDELFAKSRAAAQQAAALDPGYATAHAELGQLAFFRDWNWSEAESQFQQALDLDHNDAGARSDYSIFLMAMGRQEQALTQIQAARDLDPTSETTNVQATYALYLGHRFDLALEQASKTLELFPRSASTYYWLGEIYEGMGKEAEAGAAYVKEFGGASSQELLLRRKSFEDGGLRGFWEHDLKKRADKGLLGPCWETFPRAHLGDAERTLQLLHYGLEHHCDGLQFLATEPIYDKFRQDPRFQALLHQLNLPTLQFPNKPSRE
jgi:TolB-like protein/DNA-binding winged helix-turn-helix (wHTH) protein/lipoprotein NlpI